jgi:predicted nucleic acid-binding protein
MKFWDSSAIVPLLLVEPATNGSLNAYREDADLVVWWATMVECASAITRVEREGSLPGGAVSVSLDRLELLASEWHEVQPTNQIRDRATRLLRVHPLRAADAFQLAAAIIAAEDRPTSLPFVTLDARLADAADREGFSVVRPASRV